jgi:hypothetical protein
MKTTTKEKIIKILENTDNMQAIEILKQTSDFF